MADRIVLLTNYPAQVKEIYDINLPRPRDTVSPEFLRLRKSLVTTRIWRSDGGG